MNRRTLVLLGCIACTACATERRAGGPTQLTGTIVDTWITESGDVFDPWGPDDVHVSVVCPGPQAWRTIPGAVDPSGAFTFADVPSGDCFLRMDKQGDGSWPVFVRAATDHIDLGDLLFGRPDAVVAAQPTVLGVEADRMAAWHPLDELDLFSLGAGVTAYGIERQANLVPDDGATALHGFTVDLTKLPGARVIDGGRGDHLIITHFTRTMLPAPYDTIEEALSAPAPPLSEGAVAGINEPFQPAGAAKPVRIDWRETAFFAQRTNVNPLAHDDLDYVAIYADPSGPRRIADDDPPVLMFSGFRTADITPADVPFTASIVNPYPAAWTPRTCARSLFSFDWLPPDVKVEMSTCAPSAAATGPLVPAISPPRHLEIDGKDIEHPFQQSGRAPTLRWQAPPEGATLYDIDVRQQAADQSWPVIAAFVTDLTSVQLPPDLLAPDQPWVAAVFAYRHRSLSSPNAAPGDDSYAPAMSARLMP